MQTLNMPTLGYLAQLQRVFDEVLNELKSYWTAVFRIGSISHELSKRGIDYRGALVHNGKISCIVGNEMIAPERPMTINPFSIIREMIEGGQMHISGYDNRSDYTNNSMGVLFDYEYPQVNKNVKPSVKRTIFELGLGNTYTNVSNYVSVGKDVVWFDVTL